MFYLIIKKRAIFILTIILLVLTGLIVRLVEIQLVKSESFSEHHVNLIEASVEQRTQELVIDEGRGRFVDRNNKALTHEYYPSLVLFPFLNNISWPIEQVADILNISTTDLSKAIANAKEPIVYGEEKPLELTETQMNQINNLEIPGVLAVHRQYELENEIAQHLVGIVRENHDLLIQKYPEKVNLSSRTKVGITGLQETFDEFLIPDGEAKLLYHVAGDGNPLFGIDVKYSAPANPFYPVAIKTTLDRDIQAIAEEVVTNRGIVKGGLVLLDVETGDILAMVSKPSINHSDPFTDGSADNQMLLPHFPGSVFKTVTAAAAIEKNHELSNRTFDCDLNIYGDGPATYQNGELNFNDSFAKSCNYTFATIANEIIKSDPEYIEEFSEKLGLLGPVGWHGDVFRLQDFQQFKKEYKGKVWGEERDKNVPKAVAQIAIGQKDVRIPPLAVANMMATIARGGEKKQIRSVTEVLYKNGTTLFSFPEQAGDDNTISPYTAMKLQELLREVVTTGTATRFDNLDYKVAGKTGTAETGRESDGQDLVNKWFAGYFPFKKPKYALVVVDIDQAGSKAVTNEVFYDFVDRLYKLDQEKP